jgi:hypothetical protein
MNNPIASFFWGGVDMTLIELIHQSRNNVYTKPNVVTITSASQLKSEVFQKQSTQS